MYHFDLFKQYKLQPNKWPDRDLVWRAIVQWVVESFIIFPLAGYFIFVPILQRTAAKSLPSLPIIAFQLVVLFLTTDCLFYWAHRTLHTPFLYARIHKKHHEFKTTVGMTFEYSHVLETITNIVSVLVGPYFLACHPYVTAMSIGIRMWESVDCHSGYAFPWWISPWSLVRETARHDFHHSKNMGSFGVLAWWDKLCGTSQPYEDYIAAKQTK